MRSRLLLLLAAATLPLLPAAATAAPIYVSGDDCPAVLGDPGTRQYTVDQAVACVYDTASNNITGTDTQATTYLNTGSDPWGAGWVGAGQDASQANETSGDFTFANAQGFGQIAVALKGGGSPHWAIFLLPVGVFEFDWSIIGLGGAGQQIDADLSHMAFFGRGGTPGGGTPGVQDIPEPASLLLLLAGGIGAAAFTARRRQKAVR